jgi:phosphohistidine phosphatase
MRVLYIGRHARSDEAPNDHDRPLNSQGLADAEAMAQRMARRKSVVDLIVTSTALRARTTAEAYARTLGATPVDHFDPDAPRPQLVLEPLLYRASSGSIARLAADLPDTAPHVMFFGHNPSVTDAVMQLSGRPIGHMAPGSIARIVFDVDEWAAVFPGIGRLDRLDRPDDGG